MPYLIFVSLIWGFSFVIIKGSLTSLDSNFVSFARLLLSLVLFIPLVRVRGTGLSDRFQLMLIGSVQFGFMYIAYIAAFRDLPAHVIALLTTTTPIFVSITSGLYGGKIRGSAILTALLAVAGGAVLQFPHQAFSANLRGVVLVQVSNAAFAFGQIAYRRWMAARPELKDSSVFAFPYLGAVLVACVASLATTRYNQLQIQSNQWLALLYLGIIASGLSFFLWNLGARKVNAGILAVMNNMKIPVGVLASLLILREQTDWIRLLIGCALMFAAVYLNEKMERSRQAIL
jgi:drug/metabolite transporter (DMT)-like permease